VVVFASYISYALGMKLIILYRPNSEHATEVETYARDLEHTHDEMARRMELVSVDTREGSSMASLYDILNYPALLAVADNGSLLNSWVGQPLPLMDEVAGYATM
jgi:hypothetical protein